MLGRLSKAPPTLPCSLLLPFNPQAHHASFTWPRTFAQQSQAQFPPFFNPSSSFHSLSIESLAQRSSF